MWLLTPWCVVAQDVPVSNVQVQPHTQRERDTARELLDLRLTLEHFIERQSREKADDEPREDRKEKREAGDLEAQQSMADSAVGVLRLAWVQFFVGGLTLALVFATFRLTRNNARNELRAYVFLDGARRDRIKETAPWDIVTSFKNFGQTPAYRVRIGSTIKIVSAVEEDTFVTDNPQIDISLDMAPGHSFTNRKPVPGLSDPETWAAFKEEKLVVLFWGRIEYADAFGSERWVSFRYAQRGGAILNLMACRVGNGTSESGYKRRWYHLS